jgi:hypothetical protein
MRAVRLKAQFTMASGGGHGAGAPLPRLHLAPVMPLALAVAGDAPTRGSPSRSASAYREHGRR